MKKAISLFLAILMVVGLVPALDLSAAAEDGLIEVRTVADLDAVRNNPTGNYILLNDIDLTAATAPGGDYDYNGTGWLPIYNGTGWLPISSFSGTFDGNGHSITGMRIQGDIPIENIGLFGIVNGTVKNLALLDVNINVAQSGSALRTLNCGAIAGCLYGGEIENCVVSGTVSTSVTTEDTATDSTENNTGGICGIADTATVTQCTNKASLHGGAKRTGNYVEGDAAHSATSNCGGICGYATKSSSTFSYCVNNGSVSCTSEVGGNDSAVAHATGICQGSGSKTTITLCVNNGSVDSTASASEKHETYAYGIGKGKITYCINTGVISSSGGDKSRCAIGEASAPAAKSSRKNKPPAHTDLQRWLGTV